MIWFLLLSLLPIGVMVVFVRQTVSDTITDLAKADGASRVSLLASEISSSVDERQVQRTLTDISDETRKAFVVAEDGRYVAHSEPGKAGSTITDDFGPEVAGQVIRTASGIVVDRETGDLVAFSTVPAAFTKAVMVIDASVVSAPMLKIEQSALIQLAVSLVLIDLAVGAALWVFFRPIQQLTRAAEEVGAGNLDVQLDPDDMEGELEILTRAFNQMTRQIREAYEVLEQRVAERTAELSESEERLRTVVTSAPIVLFAIDRDGIFTLSEGESLAALGLEPGQLVGRSAFEIYKDVPQIERDLRRALAGEKVTSVVDVAGLTFESRYSSVRNVEGDVVGLIGVSTDITERRRAETALQASEEEYRALFEQSRDAIFISSAEGKISHANQAALDLFGLTAEEAIGSDLGEWFVESADRDRVRAKLEDTGSVRDFEVKFRDKDGRQMECLLTCTRRLAEDGTNLGLQGVVRDITDRKHAEETRRELAVIQERNRMAGEIHDTLAQGFTGIVLQLEAGEQALEEGSAELPEHLTRAKQLARESLREARRSVWDLVPERLEHRSLEEALRGVVAQFEIDGPERCSFTRIGDTPEVPSGTQTALLRICQEALINARKHARATRVDVALTYMDSVARLTVNDDGIGFDGKARDASDDHSGFGLRGMEQRAGQLDGTLVIRRNDGGGTLVEAEIPLAGGD